MQGKIKTPLVVDLDGTLVKTDFLYESFLLFVKLKPLNIFYLFYWLLTKNREFIKSRIAECVNIDVSLIPYNYELIEWLKAEKKQGRKIILATAAHQKYALAVAQHLNIFESVLATQENINLKGQIKAKKLAALYGNKGFIYVGDSKADLHVWALAKAAVVITASKNFTAQVAKFTPVDKVFQAPKNKITLLKAMRVHQWVKNLLVFVPLLTSHNLLNIDSLINCVLSFIAFCLCASSVYITNDFFDLAADRKHPSKYRRVFASGDLSLDNGSLLMGICLILAMIFASVVSIEFLGILIVYYLLTLSYTLYFKHKMMMDIVLLASLYTIRIIAGAIAINVTLSFWLLAFSMFIFLHLAVIKRYTELIMMKRLNLKETQKIRGYYLDDLGMLACLASVSGYISVLVMALYVNSSEVIQSYKKPEILWFFCPLLLYWIGRILVLASRGKVDDDPIIFLIKDKASWLTIILMGLIFLLAI